ncbi:DNA-directed RNA polymerase subunit alpha [Anthocerotibacter panamensis]|uniref:DNA-directed RNA polymerase subunit alpha n=1 Tax=Anthocerotibacter panamensis TaxID=2857077 RepID=UPI001C404A3D|nr:DNA-directed RNA polymerase subunit alpha [Anthocerotibacter panamensis]
MAPYTIECVDSRAEKDLTQYGRFVLEPLERGQGTTLGNALRRVLLSNLEGSSVTAVRITGVNHEFATIPGVREDVLDILLNMKELVIRSYTSDLQVGRLATQGPKIVTAADLELPSEAEVVNRYHPIAHLAEGAQLEMEFQIERGKGYRVVDRSNGQDAISVDYLAIDAVFMPVRKVNYTVEAALVGETLDKDRLTLEIWTNGSITPQEALSQSARVLVDLLKPLQEITFEALVETSKPTQDKTAQIAIEELQLSVRAYNCLKRAQINYVADLLQFTEEDLLEIKNFGQKSAEEVIEALRDKLGLTLPKERPVRS